MVETDSLLDMRSQMPAQCASWIGLCCSAMMTSGCLINAKAVDVARVLGILHHAQGTLQKHRAFTTTAVASVSLSQAGVSCGNMECAPG